LFILWSFTYYLYVLAGSMFGAATGGGFGLSTFGQTSSTTTTSPFGQPQPAAQQTGTGNPKYQPTSETDQNGTVNHQAITAMPAYSKKTFEELRWEDYQAGKKNAQAAAPILGAQAPGTPHF
jgi:nuclear pore complex protein Nup98-Nup96